METLPQDYYKPVSELNDKELWMSTLTEDSQPKSFGDNKICLLCGIHITSGPAVVRNTWVSRALVKMVSTHVIDNFLKNVGTSAESIKIQVNLMGDTVEIPTLTLTKFLRILT